MPAKTLLWCQDLLQTRSNICYIKFFHDDSRSDLHGNVHDNVNVFGLGRIDLLRCCCSRASNETDKEENQSPVPCDDDAIMSY